MNISSISAIRPKGLTAEHARYITGQALVVDGGVSLLSPAR